MFQYADMLLAAGDRSLPTVLNRLGTLVKAILCDIVGDLGPKILSYKVMSLLLYIGSLSCYSHESCGHVERLEWLAWFVLGYRDSFLS